MERLEKTNAYYFRSRSYRTAIPPAIANALGLKKNQDGRITWSVSANGQIIVTKAEESKQGK